MSVIPFFIVTLTHATWEEALECFKRLPAEAIPELRLDLYPEGDLEEMIHSLRRYCVVTLRRASEGGRWKGTEEERMERLVLAAQSRPAWIDLEWDAHIPDALRNQRSHIRLIRSVHVAPGVFDLEERLKELPEGDAYKWVGHAQQLSDNAKVKPALAWARDHGISLSAFFQGAKGVASRCMQCAWGGSFTYACPDNGPAAAPGQIPISSMRSWRLHKLNRSHGLCGVLGSPVLHSKGPAFHNQRFQAGFKDLIYLPLECESAPEAAESLKKLSILGASLTAPLKETLPPLLGLQGPLNTIWHRAPGEPWQSANTDSLAIGEAIRKLPAGPVLLLGDGGAAQTTLQVLEQQRRTCIQVSRHRLKIPVQIAHAAPVGVIQATTLGMNPEDPMPFPELLEAAKPTLKWAVEWIYKEDTAFAQWARTSGLMLVDGGTLFESQATAQSKSFIGGCGE
jgi:3-dehydroquinate dehydratase / shikimate dehydrogenase